MRWLDDGLASMDQPTFDGLNTYFVSRAARECGLTVALFGLGADELFGGYPFFRSIPWLARLSRAARRLGLVTRHLRIYRSQGVSGPLKTLALLHEPPEAGLELLAAYQTAQALFPKWTQDWLLGDMAVGDNLTWYGLPYTFVDFLKQEDRDAEAISRVSRYALRLFLGQRTLRDTDSMSMGVSLEVQAPFTDHVFLEALWQEPGKLRCRGAPDKPRELELVRPYLGDDFPKRRKQGFVFPFQQWLQKSQLGTTVKDALASAPALRRAGLEPTAVRAFLERQFHHSLAWSRVWALYTLVWWVNHHGVHI